MIDIVKGMPQAKGMDFSQAAPLRRYGVTIRGSNSFSELAGSDVVVITAGIPRKPGMDRMDLLRTNADIVGSAARSVAEYAPNSTIVVVSNPLDIMCTVALEASGFALKRVMGMAGILDSTRFRFFVAEKLGVAVTDVMAHMADGCGVTAPILRFSGRRKHADGTPTGTGATVWSIDDLVGMHGEAQVAEWRRAGLLSGQLPHDRIVRLGDPTLLASVAHEAAHVVVADRWPGAAAHGKRFVEAMDETATLASLRALW